MKRSKNRCVVVIDRGWIYCGDVTDEHGRVYLDRAVWVFSWRQIGFAGVLEHPEKADIRPVKHRVNIPRDAEIYRVEVEDEWGLKKS
jgi:hypothetical protein